MAITRNGTGATATSASTSSLTITHGLTINENDFIVVCVNGNSTTGNLSSNAGNPTFSGFEEAGQGGFTGRVGMFWRVAGASEPTSYTFDQGSADRLCITLDCFTGVDTTTPWDVQPSASSRASGGTTSVTTTSLTTATDGNWGFGGFMCDATSNFSAYSNSYANEVEDNTNQTVAHVSREFATAGSQGTITATLSGTQDWQAYHVAMAIAAAGITIEVPLMNTPLW